jgi:acyl-coenzyme A synthetase/AMP-(fatty) acid ligase
MASEIAAPGRDAPPRMTDLERERASFSIDVPERFNAVVDVLDRWAADEPDAVALVSLDAEGDPVASQTVADLVGESRRAGRALASLGVGAGERVLVMLPRVPAWYTAVLGAIRIGAVPMPGPALLTPRDIAYRIDRGRAVAVVADGAAAEKVDAGCAGCASLAHRLAWSARGLGDGWRDLDDLLDEAGDGATAPDPTAAADPMLLYFTSGTVGHPKMVLLSQAYALGHIRTARFWQDLRAGDRHWTISDTGWAKAAYGSLFGQWHERAAVIQVALGRPEAETILDIVARNGITSFCAPPTLYRLLVLADLGAHDLSALRHCTSAGEPLNPEVIRAWRAGTGLEIYDGYGQTETTITVANVRALPIRPGSMGRPLPGYEVEILRDDDSRAADGEVGSIAIRADPRPVGMFDRYEGESEATAARFRAGWYHTGDRAARDADGYLWFEGREDDVIISAAYRIGPFEVESTLVEHPAVAEAAVVGRDDRERTQIVCAFVTLTPGAVASEALAAELQEHCKRETAPYKYPREVHFVDELPKTVSGKIRRVELRQWLRDGRFPPA